MDAISGGHFAKCPPLIAFDVIAFDGNSTYKTGLKGSDMGYSVVSFLKELAVKI